jgi:hypothetical protein
MKIEVVVSAILIYLCAVAVVRAEVCCNCYGKTNVKAGGYCDDPIAEIQSMSSHGSCYCNSAGEPGRKFKMPNPYRQPLVPNPSLADQGLSCAQLQRAINSVNPLTYSYKPGMYDDVINGASVLAGTFIAYPFYLGLGWTTYLEHSENKRIEIAQNRIEELRQLKAERRCFEPE